MSGLLPMAIRRLPVAISLVLVAPAHAAPLPAALVEQAVLDAARANLPDTVAAVEVHAVTVRSPVDVPAGASVSFRVRAGGDEDWLGYATLEGVLAVNGVAAAPLRITAEIVAFVDLPILREPVARGEVVADRHLAVARREAGSLPGGVLRAPDAIIGRVAKRDLSLNSPVRDGDLAGRVDGARNRPVTVLVDQGALRVTTAGVLREDAAVGDLVAVWASATQAVLHGVLVTPDLVRVPLSGAPTTLSARETP